MSTFGLSQVLGRTHFGQVIITDLWCWNISDQLGNRVHVRDQNSLFADFDVYGLARLPIALVQPSTRSAAHW
jgi:hypothetical protein